MTAPVSYKTYKTDEVKAKTYNHRLATADKAFDEWASKARDWWDRYENVPKVTQATTKGHSVNVTTGVSVIDALFSGMTAVDVEFVLEAMGRATPDQALLAEAALNQEWALCDVDVDRDAAIKDALIASIGFVKVGYDFFTQKQTVARDPEAIRKEVIDLIDEARSSGIEAPDPNQIALMVPDTETREEAVRDRITVDYVAWDQIRWDPTARRWPDVRWTAQLTKMSLDEVKENPLFREYVKRNRSQGGLRQLEVLKPDSTIDRELLVTGRDAPDDGRVTVVEYWDMETGTYCTFIKGQNFVLFEGVNPFALQFDFEDRNPFVPLVLRGTNRRVRGISDMEVMLRSLNEKNLYRSRLANYIDRFVPKVKGPEDALTEEGKQALSSSEYGAYVAVDRSQDPKSIEVMTPPVLPAEAFGMNERIDNEIREATGVNELMRGLFPDRKRTATETEEVVSASAARQSEKRNTLERFHTEIAKRMLTLMQKFYNQERMARFSDPTLGQVPWAFTGADIIGQFDLGVTLSPREAHTRDSLKQEAVVGLNIMAPFAQPDASGKAALDQTTLLGWFMRKYGFSKRDVNELLNTQEEMQVQAAGAAQAAAGGPPPGPLSPAELLAASNGPQQVGAAVGAAVPQDIQAAAQGGFGPGAPEAARQVSNSRGVQ